MLRTLLCLLQSGRVSFDCDVAINNRINKPSLAYTESRDWDALLSRS